MSRLDARRQRLLAAMDITVWQPRVSQSASPGCSLMVIAGGPDVPTGQAGELLDNMLAAIGLRNSETVVVISVDSSVNADSGQLSADIKQHDPAVILALGTPAAEALKAGVSSAPVVVSFDPAALLADPQLKAQAWEDLLAVQRALTEAA
jgi:uracil-DNA glycosylase